MICGGAPTAKTRASCRQSRTARSIIHMLFKGSRKTGGRDTCQGPRKLDARRIGCGRQFVHCVCVCAQHANLASYDVSYCMPKEAYHTQMYCTHATRNIASHNVFAGLFCRICRSLLPYTYATLLHTTCTQVSFAVYARNIASHNVYTAQTRRLAKLSRVPL